MFVVVVAAVSAVAAGVVAVSSDDFPSSGDPVTRGSWLHPSNLQDTYSTAAERGSIINSAASTQRRLKFLGIACLKEKFYY